MAAAEAVAVTDPPLLRRFVGPTIIPLTVVIQAGPTIVQEAVANACLTPCLMEIRIVDI